jgi:hypothetical protein
MTLSYAHLYVTAVTAVTRPSAAPVISRLARRRWPDSGLGTAGDKASVVVAALTSLE